MRRFFAGHANISVYFSDSYANISVYIRTPHFIRPSGSPLRGYVKEQHLKTLCQTRPRRWPVRLGPPHQVGAGARKCTTSLPALQAAQPPKIHLFFSAFRLRILAHLRQTTGFTVKPKYTYFLAAPWTQNFFILHSYFCIRIYCLIRSPLLIN
jgi:hypothetical protein